MWVFLIVAVSALWKWLKTFSLDVCMVKGNFLLSKLQNPKTCQTAYPRVDIISSVRPDSCLWDLFCLSHAAVVWHLIVHSSSRKEVFSCLATMNCQSISSLSPPRKRQWCWTQPASQQLNYAGLARNWDCDNGLLNFPSPSNVLGGKAT